MRKIFVLFLAIVLMLFGCSSNKSFENVEVEDVIKFGSYEQDTHIINGKEGIEWIVLEKEDNRILVISRYLLDCMSYDTKDTDVTWETCSLREWLNNTFLNEAFNKTEQNRIISVTITADKNSKYDTTPGNDTTDKVFLLSTAEVEQYFSSDGARKCEPTAYCAEKRVRKHEPGNFWWWLRSPGSDSTRAVYVDQFGSVNYEGNYVNDIGVITDFWSDEMLEYNLDIRPAMWITIE